jgi:hypothetical protein
LYETARPCTGQGNNQQYRHFQYAILFNKRISTKSIVHKLFLDWYNVAPLLFSFLFVRNLLYQLKKAMIWRPTGTRNLQGTELLTHVSELLPLKIQQQKHKSKGDGME